MSLKPHIVRRLHGGTGSGTGRLLVTVNTLATCQRGACVRKVVTAAAAGDDEAAVGCRAFTDGHVAARADLAAGLARAPREAVEAEESVSKVRTDPRPLSRPVRSRRNDGRRVKSEKWLFVLRCMMFPFSSALLSCFLLAASAGDAASPVASQGRAHAIKGHVTVQSVSVDKRRDGPVGYRIRFDITSSISGAGIAIECVHREAGVPNWALFTAADDKTNQASADGVLIGQALVLAAKTLRQEYSSDPIWAVCLSLESMPREFTKTAFQGITEEMRGLRSKPSMLSDEKVRALVARAYRKMEVIRQIATALERDGFSVRIDTDELCHLRRSVGDSTWQDISALPEAGLDLETARCWLFLEVRDKR